jgi:3-mercaptopyruvate sulfurtransferase SseA
MTTRRWSRFPETPPLLLAGLLLVLLAASGPAQEPGGLASVPRISLAEFRKLVEAGTVVVLDVRSPQAYREGHIPGAISVPLETVAARAAEWRGATRPVVTYCT